MAAVTPSSSCTSAPGAQHARQLVLKVLRPHLQPVVTYLYQHQRREDLSAGSCSGTSEREETGERLSVATVVNTCCARYLAGEVDEGPTVLGVEFLVQHAGEVVFAESRRGALLGQLADGAQQVGRREAVEMEQ